MAHMTKYCECAGGFDLSKNREKEMGQRLLTFRNIVRFVNTLSFSQLTVAGCCGLARNATGHSLATCDKNAGKWGKFQIQLCSSKPW